MFGLTLYWLAFTAGTLAGWLGARSKLPREWRELSDALLRRNQNDMPSRTSDAVSASTLGVCARYLKAEQRRNGRALAALCLMAFTAGALAGWLGAR